MGVCWIDHFNVSRRILRCLSGGLLFNGEALSLCIYQKFRRDWDKTDKKFPIRRWATKTQVITDPWSTLLHIAPPRRAP